MDIANNNPGQTHDYHIRKDSGSARTIQKIRRLFLTGHSFTARELNVLIGLDDVRKVISVLRSMGGCPIVNCRLSDRRKIYRLEKGGER